MTPPARPGATLECRTCSHLCFAAHVAYCELRPTDITTPGTAACVSHQPIWYPPGALCVDCAHFIVFGLRLRCGKYPGADAQQKLKPCPSFTSRTSTPQPSGD